jgi:primosomal protein N'
MAYVLTRRGAARVLGVSIRQIVNYERAGRLAYGLKHGRHVFDPAVVEQLRLERAAARAVVKNAGSTETARRKIDDRRSAARGRAQAKLWAMFARGCSMYDAVLATHVPSDVVLEEWREYELSRLTPRERARQREHERERERDELARVRQEQRDERAAVAREVREHEARLTRIKALAGAGRTSRAAASLLHPRSTRELEAALEARSPADPVAGFLARLLGIAPAPEAQPASAD